MIKLTKRHPVIRDSQNKTIFEMKNVLAPESWSDLAVEIAASKYFRKTKSEAKEHSIEQLVDRVLLSLKTEAKKQKHFKNKEDSDQFFQSLKMFLLEQKGSFNSPVWFNAGLWLAYKTKSDSHTFKYDPKTKKVKTLKNGLESPQVSACFIQSIEDSMEGIYKLLENEARLFKFGSGSGTNFSALRSKYEKLSGGGTSSGVISFLEIFDKAAGAIKSGGTTRRAAKMVCLDVDHPEIFEFVEWKKKEEDKAKALIKFGYDSHFEGEAYRTVSGQNSNNSVRVTDEFLKAVEKDEDFFLKGRFDQKFKKKIKAKDLWLKIAETAWACADPGLQFHTTINSWNPCPKSADIKASNPCSEYMFLDNTACNLASLNLVKFLNDKSEFQVDEYLKTAEVFFTAQDLFVDHASYPTETIAMNSVKFRPLGLGFAGLGAFLMRKAIPYDSELGRQWAGVLTALLCGQAALQSAKLAKQKGAFSEFKKNKTEFLKVMKRHLKAAENLEKKSSADLKSLSGLAKSLWAEAIQLGSKTGFRNAQFTVMAPTGTIGLVMDAETTGVEPEFSLVRFKTLAGGGFTKMSSPAVKQALKILKYSDQDVQKILSYIETHQEIESCPLLRKEHQNIFDCAQQNKSGGRYLSPEAHLKMMAQIQPFLSGAISKTVNLPESATSQQIADLHLQAWKLGLKSIAIYRDKSKGAQPLQQTPACADCGKTTVLEGGCYVCKNCGYTTGCLA